MGIRRRRLVLIAALVTLGLGAIALSGVVWLLGTRSGKAFIIARVQSAVASGLHGKVYFGRLGGSLLSAPTLDSLEVRDPDDSVVVTTGRISFSYDLLDLWDQRIALHALHVEHPLFHLRKDSAGKWNLDKLFGPEQPSKPKAPGRHFGDVVMIDSLVIHDGEFRWTEPWTPPENLHGAARDSAIAAELAKPDQSVRRAGTNFVKARRWTSLDADAPYVRVKTPDSAGLTVALSRFAVNESQPPMSVHDARGTVRFANDTFHIDVGEFHLPGSAGALRGTLATKDGLAIALHVTGDTVSLADIAWLMPNFPKDGGGRMSLDVRKERTRDYIEWALSKMDVQAARSRLTGAMTFGVGNPMLEITGVDLGLDPVDFKLFEEFAGKPLTLPWAGQLRGQVRGPGGPLDAFVLDTAIIAFSDANVPGVVNAFRGRGGLDIVDPALLKFHNFALAVDRFDLRTARAVDTGFPPLEGSVAGFAVLDSSWMDVRFHDADMRYTVDSAPASRFTGSGRVTSADSLLVYDLDLVADPISLDALARSYPKLPVRGSFRGPVTVRGTAVDLAMTGDVVSDAGRVAASVRLNLVPPVLGASGKVEWFGLDPAQMFVATRDWPAELTGSAEFALRGESLAGLDGNLRATLGRSQFSGVRVHSARGAVTFADGFARLDSLLLASDAVSARASGALGLRRDRSDSLLVTMDVDSLGGWRGLISARADSIATDSLGGTFSATARLFGNVDSLDVRFAGQGRDAVYGSTTARSLSLSANIVDVLHRRDGTMSLSADSLRVAGVRVSSASARAAISRDAANVTARVQSATGPLADASARVAWDSLGVSTAIDSARIAIGDRAWQLVSPARIASDTRGWTIAPIDLRAGDSARLTVSAELPITGPVRGAFTATALPIGDLGQLLQVPIPLSGNAQVNAQLAGTRDAPTLAFNVLARDAQLGDARVEGVTVQGDYRDRALHASLEYRSNGAPVLRGDATLPMNLALRPVARRLPDTPLRGTLVADSATLAVIESFSSAFSKATGRLDVHLALGGTWQHPRLDGRALVDHGAVTLPKLGKRTRYDDVRVSIGFHGDSISIDTLQAHNGARGSNRASIDGFLKVADLTDPEFDLRFVANDFQAIDKDGVASLKLTTTTPSGLHLAGRVSGSELTGALLINGDVFVPEIYKKNVLSLDDPDFFRLIDTTVFANRGLLPPTSSSLFDNMRVQDVRVTAGDNVWLRSDEANVKLGGELRATVGTSQRSSDRGRRTLALDGTLTAERGTYRLSVGPLQRTFQVEGGTVRFLRDPDPLNATVDIRALYTVRQYDPREARQDVRVRVTLGGTLSSLTAKLSSPDSVRVPEADLISYLVTGTPSLEIGGRASDYGTTLTRALVTSGASLLGTRVRGWDVEFSTAGTQQAYGGGGRRVGGSILSSTRVNLGTQVKDWPVWVRVDLGLCELGQVVGGEGSFDPVAFASGVGGKLEYRFPSGLNLAAGVDPATTARLCTQATTARGFVPTPRQVGLDFFRVWRF